MKIPHPIVALVWRYASKCRRLEQELDEVRAELSVAKRRENRWRRHAEIASQGNPDAERRVLFQMASDDIADAPELPEHKRNTSPRSAP